MNMQSQTENTLKIAALVCGELQPMDLWALRRINSVPCALTVVHARQAGGASRWKKVRRLLRDRGPFGACSRLLASVLGSRIARQDNDLLEQLFDFEDLQHWWNQLGIKSVSVETLNHTESQTALSTLRPDIIIRISGGILKPHIFSLAQVVALNIHHGQAPRIRGMWSIPWGIIENRSDWIGATVHIIDQGIDTGGVLWRGEPQLAPGDTNVDLLFRTHLQAVEALVEILKVYSRAQSPEVWPSDSGEVSTYRSAPGIADWIRLLRLRRGGRAAVLLKRAIA